MRVLSLFSGGGLGDYGLTLAGMEIAGQVEIDDYCQKILNLRWPTVPKWRDIRDVTGKEIIEKCGKIDLISGGFPCPDFSAAGTGEGFKGKEGQLFFQAIRVIGEIRPKFILLENVGGFNRFQAEGFKYIEKLGYEYEYAYLNSLNWGTPQNRNRIFIFGIRGDSLPDSQQISRFQRRQGENIHSVCTNVENSKGRWAYPRHTKQGWSIEKDETRRSGKTNGNTNRLDRFRICGNGQSVKVVEWIGKQIIEFEKLSKYCEKDN